MPESQKIRQRVEDFLYARDRLLGGGLSSEQSEAVAVVLVTVERPEDVRAFEDVDEVAG